MADEKGYKMISAEIDGWLEVHKGESFDLDLVCRQLNIVHSQSRKYAAMKLANESKAGKLEKSNRTYRYIDNTLVYLNDWNEVTASPTLPLNWPVGIDNSSFHFEDTIEVSEKSLCVIAGVTNTGKSVFLRNFLWMNMHLMHCTYFTSETTREDFSEYAGRMNWANPLGPDGKPVFDLVDRFQDFQDVIRPDDINIIDWLNLGDKFYQIGEIEQNIKKRLNHGICFLAIQKDPNKDIGMGGMWSEHLSSVYLTLDYNRLTVKKAKKWHTDNPNGKSWGFNIVNRGTDLTDIHPVKKCGICINGKYHGQDCITCGGTGWVSGNGVHPVSYEYEANDAR